MVNIQFRSIPPRIEQLHNTSKLSPDEKYIYPPKYEMYLDFTKKQYPS